MADMLGVTLRDVGVLKSGHERATNTVAVALEMAAPPADGS
jgi:hypothetical protein